MFTRATCIVFGDTEDDPGVVLKERRGQMLVALLLDMFESEFVARIFREHEAELIQVKRNLNQKRREAFKTLKEYEELKKAVYYMVDQFINRSKTLDLSSERWLRIENDLKGHLAGLSETE